MSRINYIIIVLYKINKKLKITNSIKKEKEINAKMNTYSVV